MSSTGLDLLAHTTAESSEEDTTKTRQSQYKPIVDPEILTSLRAQGLTAKGENKVIRGDLRCRPPRMISSTFFDAKLPQFRLNSVIDTAHAEDVVIIWAHVSGRDKKLRLNEMRFDFDTYKLDTTLISELKTLGNSKDTMVEFLKSRFGTIRYPKKDLGQSSKHVPPPEPPEQSSVDISPTWYTKAFGYTKNKEDSDETPEQRLALTRALHKAAWDGESRHAYQFATRLKDFNVKLMPYGVTPLHQAVFGSIGAKKQNCIFTAERLIDNGSDIGAPDIYWKTPLHYACTRGNLEMVELLISKESPLDNVARDGSTPLHCAALGGNVQVVQKLLDAGACELGAGSYGTPLHWAIRAGNEQVVHMLLEKKFDVHAKDWYGSTPLHMAARWDKIYALRYLLGYQADREARDMDTKTALEVAITCNNASSTEILARGVENVPESRPHVPIESMDVEKKRLFWNEMSEQELEAFDIIQASDGLSWMDWFTRVLAYVKEWSVLPATAELGWWCAFQNYKKSSLSFWQIKELEGLPGWTWKSSLDRTFQRVLMGNRLRRFMRKHRRLPSEHTVLGEWCALINALKSKNELTIERQRAIEKWLWVQNKDGMDVEVIPGAIDALWIHSLPAPAPVIQSVPVPAHTEARPALDVLEDNKDTLPYNYYNELRLLLTNAASKTPTQHIKRIFQLWTECTLTVGTVLPNNPLPGATYIVYRSPKIRQDGYAWKKETKCQRKLKGNVVFDLYYAVSIDNSMKRRLYFEVDEPVLWHQRTMVQYLNTQEDEEEPSAASTMERTDDIDLTFLQSVPKKRRTDLALQVPRNNLGQAQAAFDALELVASMATAVQQREADDEMHASTTDMIEKLNAASVSNQFEMSAALKSVYDHGIGGAAMRWAASHVLGKKLGDEEKRYLFESVREYIVQGKIQEATEWVQEMQSAFV